MKNILKKTAIGVMSLALTTSVLPAQDFHHDYRGGGQVQTASWHNGDQYRGRDDGRRYERDDRGDRYRDRDRGRDNDHYYYYDRGRDYDRTHHGRDTAIILGSAAGGALIGAAAGHGEGAIVGAIVGGVGGAIADAAVRHR